jgi:hypothetical protein
MVASDIERQLDNALLDAELLRREVLRLRRAAPILDERDRQDAKWGPQDHTLPEWIAILVEEYDHEKCLRAGAYRDTLWDFDQRLRDIVKYGMGAMKPGTRAVGLEGACDLVRGWLHEDLESNGIADLWSE